MIDNLKMAISESDKVKARKIMINELIGTDYPHEVFRDALELANEYNVFDEHDKGRLISDPKEWNEEYLSKLLTGLEKNFSKERFLTTYYVARKLEKDVKEDELEERCAVRVYDKYKDFFFIAKVGAVVASVTAIGVGLLIYNKKKK